MATVSKAKKSNQTKRRAVKAGLIYLNSVEKGITRQRRGKGFIYRASNGKALPHDGVRQRIIALVIPPAWVDVFICPKSNGHIQAAGTDEAGRRQYIYHERWTARISMVSPPGLIATAETGELITLMKNLPRKANPELSIDET